MNIFSNSSHDYVGSKKKLKIIKYYQNCKKKVIKNLKTLKIPHKYLLIKDQKERKYSKYCKYKAV